jgi:hypothetical protein
MSLEALFSAIAEAVFGYLLQQSGLAERTRAVRGRDPQRLAFQTALARAYTAFARQYPEWKASLFDETFLKSEAVLPLLGDLLTRRGRPDPAELARRFAIHLGHPDPDRWDRLDQATRAAADFLTWLEAELADQPALQPLYDSRALERIAQNTEAIRQQLAEILERIGHGQETPEDINILRHAVRTGQVTLATGERAVALGGSADEAIIVTGDNNVIMVFRGIAAETVQRLFRDLKKVEVPFHPDEAFEVTRNPFRPLSGRITDPKLIFDRQTELRQALEYLAVSGGVVFVGENGVGKSSLLTLLADRAEPVLGRKPIFLDMQPLRNENDYYEALCEALGVPTARGLQLERLLRGQRILLLLDQIEKMTGKGFSRDLRAELRGLAEAPSAPLKLALVARTPLDRLFPDSEGNTSPLAGLCHQVDVRPWDIATARAFLEERLSRSLVRFAPEEVEHLVAQSGGHPQRLMRLAFDLYQRKLGGAG